MFESGDCVLFMFYSLLRFRLNEQTQWWVASRNVLLLRTYTILWTGGTDSGDFLDFKVNVGLLVFILNLLFIPRS